MTLTCIQKVTVNESQTNVWPTITIIRTKLKVGGIFKSFVFSHIFAT